ncbi:TIM-barrel domain-containing protein [Belliella marina]|uniref:TIM-barrel domain-containing protein n=1 Tax=Belliella marina TaxID=1644146 RepID=A0ABW4VF55_9BACT
MKITWKTIPLWGCVFCLYQSFAQTNYQKTETGIVVPLSNSTQKLRLQPVNERVVHVSITPVQDFSQATSLILKDDLEYSTEWTVEEDQENLSLKTRQLEVVYSIKTNQLTFKNSEGKILLRELPNTSRGFDLNENGSSTYFSLEQHFEKGKDENFYGLGQHQAGVFNYRDKQVDLTQYNGVAVVPFMVSSEGYGLLWDNYSITRFGDTRPLKPLSSLKLYSGQSGNPEGLLATYASDRQHPDKGLEKLETEIDYTFISSLEKMPDFNRAKGAVTWSGYIQPEDTGLHTFKMSYSGYIKIWMDGELKIDTWRESWNPGFVEFGHHLDSRDKHQVKISWIPESDQSFLSLNYLDPQTEAEGNTFGFASEAGEQIDYYFVYGENMDQVISGYRTLTGKAQVMPKWAMGFWQSRERYKTQDEMVETLKTFREKGIPIDNIVQDWSYWPENAWGSHEFDTERFPDPEGMVKEIHENNARVMISVWPKFYEGINNYLAMNDKGMLYTQNIQNQQRDWIGEGYVSTFYDAFNPEARKAFWNQLESSLFSKGMDAWWLDATEPDIHSNASIEERKALMNPTSMGPAEKYFNAYSLVNAKGIYQGQRNSAPDKRVFILTRSAFAGIQRYGAATWSGDIASRFDELARQIPAGLNFALSGLPYWTTDIGGFFVEDKYDRPEPQGEDLEEWRELNARWYQFGTFSPLFRAHGQFPYREIFHIAPEEHPAYQSILYYNKLRYRLMPYIYSLTGKVYHDDYTLMRALVMDFPEDENVKSIGDQFLFGPSFLVAPVTEYGQREKQVYLPQNTTWYDFYNGQSFAGGQTIKVEAAYERMPLFVKAGAIVPFGPEIQYTSEKPQDQITLQVYAGADGQFDVYDDEHTNYNYEEGHFTKIPITYKEQTGELTIGDIQGKGFEGKPEKINFKIHYIQSGVSSDTSLERKADQSFVYEGKAETFKLR